MKIIVNGSEIQIEKELSISELIISYSLDENRVIALKDDSIIKKEKYESFILGNGDKIELLSIVGGG